MNSRYRISPSCLPTQGNMLQYFLLALLFDKVYEWSVGFQVAVYGLLLIAFLFNAAINIVIAGKEPVSVEDIISIAQTGRKRNKND